MSAQLLRVAVGGALALGVLSPPGSTVRGQPSEPAQVLSGPWHDLAPARDGGWVRATAVGAPDERVGRFEARRASARAMARARAIAALHRWADDSMARQHVRPWLAEAVHRAIDQAARARAVRPLVDAGAVVTVEVPVERLRAACSAPGLAWND